jgi:sulfonate transport system permease protein
MSAIMSAGSRNRGYRGWVLPIAAIAVWWLASSQGWSQSGLLVSPEKVATTAWDQMASGKFWRAISASLARNLSGFFIGTTLGLVLGACWACRGISNVLWVRVSIPSNKFLCSPGSR